MSDQAFVSFVLMLVGLALLSLAGLLASLGRKQ